MGLGRIVRVVLALPVTLLALSSHAVASTGAAWSAPADVDARAIVGTVVIGVAGGLVLAILDGTGDRTR
jgi:hypothetical protein